MSKPEEKEASVDNKIFEEISDLLVDFATAIESAAVQLKQQISRLHGVGLKEDVFLSLVGWSKSQGERLGEFEFTSRKANQNSDAFNRAYNVLKANDANIKQHFSEKGWRFYYWVFPDRPDTIYRKLRKGKEQEPQAEKGAGPDIEAVKIKFPPDLASLLTFEVEGKFTVIKPRQFLGSDNFSKIASIVRDLGGEYLSMGKQSHFRVPVVG